MDAFYQCHKQRRSLFQALQSFREFNPSSIIVLVNDRGDDHTDVAKYFNCKYYYRTNQIGRKSALLFDSFESCSDFLENVRTAIQHFTNKWFMMLEDDVRVIGQVNLGELKNEINGCNPGAKFPTRLLEYIHTHNPYACNFYGACGGCILNTEHFRRILQDPCINKHVQEYFERTSGRGASDMLLSFLNAINGGHIGMFHGFYEMWWPFRPEFVAVIHQYKNEYDKELDDKDAQKLATFNKLT
jgi:hypothetical protein